MKYLRIITLIFSMPILFLACEDSRTGEIVEEEQINGLWGYNGAQIDVKTSFIVAKQAIEADIESKIERLTSKFNIELTEDERYIITDQTVLQDSGRYILDSGELIFKSKMLESPFIENSPVFSTDNDLTITFDRTAYYSDSTRLDSLGIEKSNSVEISDVKYYYLFKKIK